MTLPSLWLPFNAFNAQSGMELAINPRGLILSETGSPKAESILLPWDGYGGGNLTVLLDMSVEDLVTTGNVRLSIAFRKVTARATPFDETEYDTPKQVTISRGATAANLQSPKPSLTFASDEIDGLVAGDRGQILITRDNTVGSNASGIAYLHSLQIQEA